MKRLCGGIEKAVPTALAAACRVSEFLEVKSVISPPTARSPARSPLAGCARCARWRSGGGLPLISLDREQDLADCGNVEPLSRGGRAYPGHHDYFAGFWQ